MSKARQKSNFAPIFSAAMLAVIAAVVVMFFVQNQRDRQRVREAVGIETEEAYEDIARRQCRTILGMITMYELDTRELPPTLNALREQPEGVDNWKGPYTNEPIPNDPWDRPYEFRNGVIRSAGVDGVTGTGDDIVSLVKAP